MGVRLALWLLLAWPTPALIAGTLGWKGVWGSGSALADYLIPIPVAGGTFHTLTFAGISALLLSQRHWPKTLQGLAHAVLFGISLVGLLLVFDFEQRRLTQNPVGLFLLTDSLIAQLFVPAFGGRGPQGIKEWALGALAIGMLPVLATAGLRSLDPRSRQDFVLVNSRAGPERGDQAYLIHARMPVTAAKFREAAAAYAQQWHPRDNINTEDVAVHFFASLPAAQIGNEYEATLTYCLYQDGTPAQWYAGKGDCFAHVTVTERAQKLYEAQDPKLPVDERVRLARAKACEGVRVPAEDNAIAQLCAQKKR